LVAFQRSKKCSAVQKIAEKQVEIVGCSEKISDEKQLQEVTEHSIEDLKNS